MELEIKKLNKKDYNKFIQYAIKGMHFNMYLDNKLELNLYGRYFGYLELTNATQVISAYIGNELAGVLIADFKGEEKAYKSFWKSLYVNIFDWIQKTFFKESVGIYDKVNKEMLENYKSKNNPDGELVEKAKDTIQVIFTDKDGKQEEVKGTTYTDSNNHTIEKYHIEKDETEHTIEVDKSNLDDQNLTFKENINDGEESITIENK